MSLVLLNELPNCKRILKPLDHDFNIRLQLGNSFSNTNSWSSGFNIRLQLGNSFSNTKLMI